VNYSISYKKRRQFTEDQARFYAAQIVLAIEHLHSLDIIYRDLKPENVLIDKDGFIRLTDFGLSKKNIQGNKGANSVCGTPEYLAPELLFKLGHGKAADWWTLGAILFEMLTGLPPFYTSNRDELFKRIKYESLKFPSYLSMNAKSLLDGLFKKNPEERLGGSREDAEAIKRHAWFDGVDWDVLLSKKVRPPFVPKTKNEVDVSNFDAEFTETPLDSLKEQTLMDQFSNGQSLYQDWSFNGDSAKSKLFQNDEEMGVEMQMEMDCE